MKKQLLILNILFSVLAFGQYDDLAKKLPKYSKPIDCEKISLHAANKLSIYLVQNKQDSIERAINDWVLLCGKNELTQRLTILNALLNKKPITDDISIYFNHDFHHKYYYRIANAKKIDYGYRYSDYKSYYGYVPLNHPIDSIIKQKSIEILNSKSLSPDEELISILFSENSDKFEETCKQNDYKDSFIQKYFAQKKVEFHNSHLAKNIYAGLYSSLGSKNIFNNNPSIGITFSSPLRYKLLVEIGFKMRLNTNDRNFDYFASEKTNTVNSDISIFGGGLVGYKLFETKKLILIPKLGVGIESVDTGLYESDRNNNKEYFDLKTIHLSIGLSAMTPILTKNYIGIEISYHYTPYQLDKNLLTDLETSALSTEVFFRF